MRTGRTGERIENDGIMRVITIRNEKQQQTGEDEEGKEKDQKKNNQTNSKQDK